MLFRWRILVMKKKDETKKICPCGRIITNPNNKTGLCPKCQKNANNVVAGVGLAGILVGAKKFGPKLIKNVIKIIKKQ